MTHFKVPNTMNCDHQLVSYNMIDNRRWCKLSYFRDNSETILFVFPALKYAKGMKHTCCKLKNKLH